MARALAAVRAARRHATSVLILVSCPAGIGKTALMSEICRQATASKLRVARGKCDRIAQVSPGAPVIAALRVLPRSCSQRSALSLSSTVIVKSKYSAAISSNNRPTICGVSRATGSQHP